MQPQHKNLNLILKNIVFKMCSKFLIVTTEGYGYQIQLFQKQYLKLKSNL